MKKIISIVLATGLLLSLITINQIEPLVASASNVSSKYVDYDPTAEWGKPMEWAIGKGLFNGVIEKNSKTGKNESFLKPNKPLTESQFFTILSRYTDPKRSWDPYWYAIWYSLPLSSDVFDWHKPIPRGKMAQILATKYYDKLISEKDAIEFMYKAGISSGYSVDGKFPKTYESYGANNHLKRSQVAQLFQAFDAFLESGQVIVNTTKTKAEDSPSGIEIQYGWHTYGSENQKEYDAVLKNAKQVIGNFHWYTLEKEYIDLFLSGERWDGNQLNQTDKNMELARIELSYGDLVLAGATNEEIIDMIKGQKVVDAFLEGKIDPVDNSTISAYDTLNSGVANSNSENQIYMLVFDIMGFNTMEYGYKPSDTYVKAGSSWIYVKNGTFKKVPLDNIDVNQFQRQDPTYGPF